MIYCLWSIFYDLLSMIYCLWSIVYDRLSMIYCLLSMIYWLWTIVYDLLSLLCYRFKGSPPFNLTLAWPSTLCFIETWTSDALPTNMGVRFDESLTLIPMGWWLTILFIYLFIVTDLLSMTYSLWTIVY